MHTIFPAYNHTEGHTLFIIGNGFDLAHSMRTKYADFRDWLKSQGEHILVEEIEYYFNIDPETWSDFEHALGDYDLQALYDYSTDGLHIDYKHMMRSVFLFEDSPDIWIEPIKTKITTAFCEWISTIHSPSKPLSIGFNPNNKYLTFNYTETLEETYQIPEEHILHIHGRVKNYEPLIFGHNNLQYDANSVEYAQWQFEETAKSKIICILNQLHKNTYECISNHIDFFESLGEIENVIILGHSYSDIDYPYFSKVKDSIKPTAVWALCTHSLKDINAASSMANSIGIPNDKYVIIKNEDLTFTTPPRTHQQKPQET